MTAYYWTFHLPRSAQLSDTTSVMAGKTTAGGSDVRVQPRHREQVAVVIHKVPSLYADEASIVRNDAPVRGN